MNRRLARQAHHQRTTVCKWIRQMRQALERINGEVEDLDHRVSFVNAAIECCNFLRRRISREHDIIPSHGERSRSRHEKRPTSIYLGML
ncbi:MAG: hypothetical protein AB9873_03285 [Syntrophobacteraceae bacterium]